MFAQDDIELLHGLAFRPAHESISIIVYGTFFSPRFSALIRKAGWTSRISAGQGFFAPTPLTEETEAAGLAKLSSLRPPSGTWPQCLD